MGWRAIQLAGVAATGALLIALVAMPEPTLNVFWNAIIPLVPVSLLITPMLWRNVCPLATLNAWRGSRAARQLTAGTTPAAGTAGIALLVILVPARRFLFNTNGTALAITVLVVAGAALVLGIPFELKAGFCNAICPVLPVERLYGQRPLVTLGNPRCRPCTLCTRTGCIDLAPTKAIAQTLGPTRRSSHWLLTSFGAFAAGFPGFVVGYYTTSDGPLASAGSVYLHVAAWGVGSYLVVGVLVLLARVPTRELMPILAGTAATLYYWFASPLIAVAIGTAGTGTITIRILTLSTVAWWLWHTSVPMPQDRVRSLRPEIVTRPVERTAGPAP